MGARPSPAKPWEVNAAAPSAPTPAAASGTPAPWDNPQPHTANQPVDGTGGEATVAAAARGTPPRPWERTPGSTAATPYASTSTYGTGVSGYTGYGATGAYGRPYAGGMYGSSMYGGGNMYGMGGYGSGMYGAAGMYGSSMYNRGMYGGGMGGMGYGGGMYGGGMGMGMGGMMGQDPNAPPPMPPPRWQTILSTLQSVMMVFGRISFLVDENTQAVHFFITALLQLFDRAGCLYAELARFVLRLLGFNPPPPAFNKEGLPGAFGSTGSMAMQTAQQTGQAAEQAASAVAAAARHQQARTGMPAGAWNNLWSGQGGASQGPRGLP